MQPGVELGALLERVDRFERFDERFLHGILSILVGAEKAPGDGKQAAAVGAHDLFEGGVSPR